MRVSSSKASPLTGAGPSVLVTVMSLGTLVEYVFCHGGEVQWLVAAGALLLVAGEEEQGFDQALCVVDGLAYLQTH